MPLIGECQYVISGKITAKENGNELTGTTVVLMKTYLGATSDFDGNYSIDNVAAGTYQIKVSHLGFKEQIKDIEVSGNLSLDFVLEQSSVMKDEFTVTATRVNEKTGMAFTNVSKEELEKNNTGQDIPYILKLTPNLVETSDGGTGVGYTYVRIRGSDESRINVTINGIPQNDAEDHGVYWVDMPDMIGSVDNIQIQRGVGTSTNGGSAFGATINMQTTVLDTAAHAESNTTYGSYHTWKNNLSFGTGLIDGKWDVEGRLSDITSNGYMDRASSDLKSFFASCGYYGKNSVLKFNIFSGIEKTYQAWNGVPQDTIPVNRTYNVYTYPNETDNYQMDNFQLLYSSQLNSNWNVNAALHYTHGFGYYEQYVDADNPYNPANPTDFQPSYFSSYGLKNAVVGNDTILNTNLIRQLWLDNQFYGTTFSINYNSNKKLKLTIGGAANRYNGDHYTKIVWAQYASNSDPLAKYQDNTAVKKDANIYAKVYYEITKKLNLFGDIQYRNINYTFLGYDQYYNNTTQTANLNFVNPKGGINYDLNSNMQIYASYSIGNREPVRDDYVQSTPLSRPKAEHLQDLEIGYKKESEWLSYGINYYYMYYTNQLALTGQLNDVGAYIDQNIPQSYRAGAEIETAIRIRRNLDLQGNISFSQNRIFKHDEYLDVYDASGNWIGQDTVHYKATYIAFSPAIVSSIILNWHPVKNLTLSFINKYVSKQYLDNTSDESRAIAAYNINDFRIRYTIKIKPMKEIGLSFNILNVFNKLYESNGWDYTSIQNGVVVNDNNYYPQAPRNYLGTITLKF